MGGVQWGQSRCHCFHVTAKEGELREAKPLALITQLKGLELEPGPSDRRESLAHPRPEQSPTHWGQAFSQRPPGFLRKRETLGNRGCGCPRHQPPAAPLCRPLPGPCGLSSLLPWLLTSPAMWQAPGPQFGRSHSRGPHDCPVWAAVLPAPGLWPWAGALGLSTRGLRSYWKCLPTSRGCWDETAWQQDSANSVALDKY